MTRSRRAKTWIRLGPHGLGAALALVLAGSAWGQNLIENGGFDEDLAGWTLFAPDESSAMWNALDASGSGMSGSLRAEMVYAGSGPNAVAAAQCVPVESEQLYTFGAQIRRPAQAVVESSFLRVQWFESEDCTDEELQTSDRSLFLPDDTWGVDDPGSRARVRHRFARRGRRPARRRALPRSLDPSQRLSRAEPPPRRRLPRARSPERLLQSRTLPLARRR